MNPMILDFFKKSFSDNLINLTIDSIQLLYETVVLTTLVH